MMKKKQYRPRTEAQKAQFARFYAKGALTSMYTQATQLSKDLYLPENIRKDFMTLSMVVKLRLAHPFWA